MSDALDTGGPQGPPPTASVPAVSPLNLDRLERASLKAERVWPSEVLALIDRVRALEAVTQAAREVGTVHKRLIEAVTPTHPGFLYSSGPNMKEADREAYDALFSAWHAASRSVRSALAVVDGGGTDGQ